MKTSVPLAAPRPIALVANPAFGATEWFAAGLVVVIYLASATWHIFYGAQNTDEGFYAVATRAVAQGEMPYRDFGFTQPPLVLYANALPLRLIGPGLFAQRALNGVWASLALLIAAAWLARRTRPTWGLVLALGFALSSPWMYFVHLGKTYGLTTLLVMLATWAFLALRSGPWRNFWLGLLTVLGIGSRLPAAPCFGLLWLLALWPQRRPTVREIMSAIGGLALGTAVAIIPFGWAAPEAVRFWVFEFHRISVPLKMWHLAWQEIAALAPAVWLLGGMALFLAVLRQRLRTRETGVMLAAGAALAINLFPGGVYDEYATPFLLPFAVAAAALVFDELQSRKTAVLLTCTGLAAAQLLTAPVLFFDSLPQRRGTVNQWLTPNTPPYNLSLPAQVATARRIVESTLAPDAPFIGPNLILAVEAGRTVPAELRMGSFSFTEEMPPAQAARLHLATREQLDNWYSRPDVTLLSFFKRIDLDYNWSMPSFTNVPNDVRQVMRNRLERDFGLAYDEGDFFLLVRRRPKDMFFR
jgi:hypothetical protein